MKENASILVVLAIALIFGISAGIYFGQLAAFFICFFGVAFIGVYLSVLLSANGQSTRS